jgi:hypothetical protein
MNRVIQVNPRIESKYEVEGIYAHPQSTKEDPYGGDGEWHSSHNTKRAAISAAKKLSKQKTWYKKPLHEVMVTYSPDKNDDPAYHAFFKNGKLDNQMF